MRHLSISQFRATAHMLLHNRRTAQRQAAHAKPVEFWSIIDETPVYVVDRDAKCFSCAGT
jgi:hypothetical protein